MRNKGSTKENYDKEPNYLKECKMCGNEKMCFYSGGGDYVCMGYCE